MVLQSTADPLLVYVNGMTERMLFLVHGGQEVFSVVRVAERQNVPVSVADGNFKIAAVDFRDRLSFELRP